LLTAIGLVNLALAFTLGRPGPSPHPSR
jgi:hypothetical protein